MAGFKRSGESVWTGGGKDGKGVLTAESGAISNLSYSFAKRFGDEKGTNPEELLAIAHAGCFNMALAVGLEKAGKKPDELIYSFAGLNHFHWHRVHDVSGQDVTRDIIDKMYDGDSGIPANIAFRALVIRPDLLTFPALLRPVREGLG